MLIDKIIETYKESPKKEDQDEIKSLQILRGNREYLISGISEVSAKINRVNNLLKAYQENSSQISRRNWQRDINTSIEEIDGIINRMDDLYQNEMKVDFSDGQLENVQPENSQSDNE